MKSYKEPDWQELEEVFDGEQRHELIADPKTGMVFANQHDLELFMRGDDKLTAFGKHLTETGQGRLVMTPDGMGFFLQDRQKTRGYWEDRARVFAKGQNGDERKEHFASEDAAEIEDSQQNAEEKECPECAGSGLVDEERLCVVCDGYGVLQVK